MNVFVVVFAGGEPGSVSRFNLSRFITSNTRENNPAAVITSNVVSTIFLGITLFFTTQRVDVPIF